MIGGLSMTRTRTRTKKWVTRVFLALLALPAIAGLGFYLRPVSYLNAHVYLEEHFVGFESRNIKVDGYRLHYLATGPARWPSCRARSRAGRPRGRLVERRPGSGQSGLSSLYARLTGLFGRSQQRSRFLLLSVHDQAAVVVDFMDALGIKQADIAGWSMGGWIVQLAASEHPERVSRLIIIDSVGLNIKPTWDTNLFVPTSLQQLDQLDALLMPNPPTIPPFIARDYLRIFNRNGWVIKRALATMQTGQDVTDNLLPQLKMPVLIVWGSLDRIVPVNQAQTMHKLIPKSQLLVIPDCGHMVPLQCATEMDPAALRFIQ